MTSSPASNSSGFCASCCSDFAKINWLKGNGKDKKIPSALEALGKMMRGGFDLLLIIRKFIFLLKMICRGPELVRRQEQDLTQDRRDGIGRNGSRNRIGERNEVEDISSSLANEVFNKSFKDQGTRTNV